MWRTELRCSKQHYAGVSVFYIIFSIVIIILFNQTEFDEFTFIAIIILVLEWWRSCCYGKMINGELALFYDLNELYWSRQRWSIIKKPIFLRYAVILHLVSKRNGKKQVLVLINDSFIWQDWRSFNYFLRQYIRP